MASREEDQGLANYLDEVASSTRSGLIEWKTANPTTFYWDKVGTPGSRISLQQVERSVTAIEDGKRSMRKQHHYIFQAFQVSNTGSVTAMSSRLTIDTTERQGLHDRLQSLFELIKGDRLRRDLEFLKSTLPDA